MRGELSQMTSTVLLKDVDTLAIDKVMTILDNCKDLYRGVSVSSVDLGDDSLGFKMQLDGTTLVVTTSVSAESINEDPKDVLEKLHAWANEAYHMLLDASDAE